MKNIRTILLFPVMLFAVSCTTLKTNETKSNLKYEIVLGENSELRNQLRHKNRGKGRRLRNELRHKSRKHGQEESRRTKNTL